MPQASTMLSHKPHQILTRDDGVLFRLYLAVDCTPHAIISPPTHVAQRPSLYRVNTGLRLSRTSEVQHREVGFNRLEIRAGYTFRVETGLLTVEHRPGIYCSYDLFRDVLAVPRNDENNSFALAQAIFVWGRWRQTSSLEY
jgi:hypothetical protein